MGQVADVGAGAGAENEVVADHPSLLSATSSGDGWPMALNLERDGEEGIVDCQSPCVSVREETVAGSVGTEQLAKETVVGGRER